jgi:hypothetical protein
MATTDPVTPDSPRFSIRLPRPLWIGLAAVALSIVAVGFRFVLPSYRQHMAIREIERVGGYVIMRPPNLAWLPRWLQDCVYGGDPTDFWLARDRMPWIRGIEVAFGAGDEVGCIGPAFTDAGMARIATLTELRCLRLGRWKTELTMQSGPIPLFEPLEAKYRRSEPAQFSDAALAYLTGMKNLEVLDLNGTRVTDTGLAHVGMLTELRSLDLRATRITDAGLGHLRRLTKLERLDLRLTNVSDSGLNELHGLLRLKEIAIDGTEVTHDGANGLRRAVPDITIEW